MPFSFARCLFSVLVLLGIASCSVLNHSASNGQLSKEESISLDYEKYTLDNGLTVILHLDKSDPLVHVDVTYHVGSAREFPGQSGFAHFFEHMMFQGSKHIADEQHFKLVTEVGGELNGSTNSDRTNYYQTVPANQLERILWLESDRMGFLLEAVTQEKFEIQRETVINERAQRVDNQPYGLRTELIAQALYPSDHPYFWPTIGFIEDIERVTLADLKDFFLRWYGPNNAVLSIGGDFNVAQTKAFIEKYFARIPKGPQVEKIPVPLVELPETRYLTLEDQVHLPLLQKTFPTVYARHPDEAALDVLADILGGGKTSLLYKNLVETGDAVQALTGHPCQELACEFSIIALANPSKTADLAAMETKIRQTLAEFEQRGVLEDDLIRVKASIKTGTVTGLQSVAGKVSILAANETFYGTPDLIADDIARYQSVTAEDVMRVYHQYVKNRHSVMLSIVPEGKLELAARNADYALPERVFSGDKPKPLPSRAFTSAFDRSVIPPMGPAPVINMPDFWQTKLDNEIELIGITTDEVPTVGISIAFEGGILLDPKDKAGLATLTAGLMNESTQNFSNVAMANELAKLGSSISVSASGRYLMVTVTSLSENIDATLALVEEKLFHPLFDEQALQRLKSRLMQSKTQQQKAPAVMADYARDKLLFGEQNRVSLPDDGTLSTLKTITQQDVKQFYANHVSSAKANIVVVGSWSENAAKSALSFLNKLPNTNYSIPPYAPFPEYDQQSIYLIDKPGAVQSVIKMVRREIPFDATGEFFRSRLMNFNLGEAFNSRINLNLREDKSITYGANANFYGGKTLGWYEVSTDVVQDSTALAISELLNEIRNFKQQGIRADELTFMQSAFTQSDALDYETPSSKAAFLRQMSAYNLAADFRQQQMRIIESITAEEINQIAQRRLHPNQLQIIVVGDEAQLMPQLESLGLPIKRLSLPE